MNTTTTTTTEKSMTMREFLVAVSDFMQDSIVGDADTAQMDAKAEKLREFAATQLEKLDAKNASRSSATAKKKAEVDAPLMQNIFDVLHDHPAGLLTSEIATAIDSTTSKVTGLCVKMHKDGLLIREEVKVPKVGKRIKYAIATQTEEQDS